VIIKPNRNVIYQFATSTKILVRTAAQNVCIFTHWRSFVRKYV